MVTKIQNISFYFILIQGGIFMQNDGIQRRHYRVAKKVVEQSPARGTFIHHEKKQKYMAFAAAILLVTFVQGLIIGFLVYKNN